MRAQGGDGARQELLGGLDTLVVDLHGRQTVARIRAEQIEPDGLVHAPGIGQREVVGAPKLVTGARRRGRATDRVAGIDR